MFIKIENNQPIGYPILEENLRAMFVDVSLPRNIKTSHIIEYGFVEYKTTQKPAVSEFQIVEEILPIFDGEYARQQWKIRNMSENEKNEYIDFKKNEVLSLVKLELANSDWTELPSNQKRKTDEWKREWEEYRDQLRKVKNQLGFPLDVSWPEKPFINTRIGNN